MANEFVRKIKKTDITKEPLTTNTQGDIILDQEKGAFIRYKDEYIPIGDKGAVLDLGTFNDQTELITHVLTNKLPKGHYTFIIEDNPCIMLLELRNNVYFGTFHDCFSNFFHFEVLVTDGNVQKLKTIDLQSLMTDVSM